MFAFAYIMAENAPLTIRRGLIFSPSRPIFLFSPMLFYGWMVLTLFRKSAPSPA